MNDPSVKTAAFSVAKKLSVYGTTGEAVSFRQRNAQLFERGEQLRVDLVGAGRGSRWLWRRVVHDVLVIDRPVMNVGPLRLSIQLLQRRPMPLGLQPPFQHPLGLILPG